MTFRIKRITGTEYSKAHAIYRMRELLDNYDCVMVTQHGRDVLVIARPEKAFIKEGGVDYAVGQQGENEQK